MSQHATSPDSWIAERLEKPQREFATFARAVYAGEALDLRTKELIAVAASSVGRCPHCTNGHLAKAREVGATEAEMAEALAVAWSQGGATQISWMQEDLVELLGRDWQRALLPEADRPFRAFERETLEEGVLDRRTKALIALVVNSMLRSRYGTRSHIESALEHGATRTQVAEALGVLRVIGSGVQIVWNKDGFETHLRERSRSRA